MKHKGGNMKARQGDLKIIRVEALPKKAQKLDTLVLLKGEVTGHTHRLEEGEVYQYGQRLFLQTFQPTHIIHEEHDPIPLEVPGVYEIERQREYTGDNMTSLVVD